METGRERNWTAQIVIASEHAGLRPHFKQLEAQMLHVLARVNDPREVKLYLREMGQASAAFLDWYDRMIGDR